MAGLGLGSRSHLRLGGRVAVTHDKFGTSDLEIAIGLPVGHVDVARGLIVLDPEPYALWPLHALGVDQVRRKGVRAVNVPSVTAAV